MRELPKLGADFETLGRWWLPGKESDVVSGRLTSKGGNLELTLLGQFDAIDVNLLLQPVPVIHGDADAKLFTLWNAIQGQFSLSMPGTVQQRFEHMRILVGGHLADKSATRFNGLRLGAANLGPWSSLRPIDFTVGPTNLDDAAFRLKTDRSRAIRLPNQGMTLTIGAAISTKNEEFSRYGFDVAPQLHVEFDDPKLFDDTMRHAESLRRIFSLLIGFEFIVERALVDVENDKRSGNSLDVLFEHVPPEDVKTLSMHEVLVPLPVISGQVQQIFVRWAVEEPRMKDAVDLFIATVRRESLRTHVELTTLAQALETFHRNVHGGGYLTKEEYQPVQKAIVDSIPQNIDEGLRGSIKDRLRHAHEFTFRSRLEKLLAEFSDELLSLLDVNRSTFPVEVSKARNEFTHWDPEAGEARLRGADLSNLVSKLKALTRLVLLSHLGIPPDAVVKRMIDNKYLYLPEWTKIDHS